MTMLKHLVFILNFFIFLPSVEAQTESINPFEGKTFSIHHSTSIDQLPIQELSFSQRHVQPRSKGNVPVERANYHFTSVNSNLSGFSFTMTIPEHCKIAWFGTKNGDMISGDYLIQKKGEDPIICSFTGVVQ